MSGPTIGFAGMTHLGINSAAASAARGFRTVCFDPDTRLIARLKAGELPVVEPGLPELLREHGAKLSFASDAAALAQCDLVYIAPDVPTDDAGQSDLAGIRSLIDSVEPRLGAAALLVVLCQVSPGFTRGLAVPAGRLFYQVETLIFGQAVERAMHPERIILGCAEPSRPLPDALAEYSARVRLPGADDALRERRAREDFDQLLPGRVGHRRQHARRAERAGRSGLERDCAGAQARPPHRPARLSRAGAGARRRQPRARPGNRAAPRRGDRQPTSSSCAPFSPTAAIAATGRCARCTRNCSPAIPMPWSPCSASRTRKTPTPRRTRRPSR